MCGKIIGGVTLLESIGLGVRPEQSPGREQYPPFSAPDADRAEAAGVLLRSPGRERNT